MTFENYDFMLQVKKGKVPGHRYVHKFGEASVGTSLQPVCESGFYRTPTSATALEIVSNNANDTSDGSGARKVKIYGLDENWQEVVQTVTMNGTAAVAIPTSLTRLYRWFVLESGTYATQSTASHVGTLTIRESGGGDIWSVIGVSPIPEGQSEIGVISIPSDETAYVDFIEIIVDSNKSVNAYFYNRDNIDDVTAPYTGIMRLGAKHIGVTGDVDIRPPAPWGPYTGPCDVGFMANTSSGTGDVSIDFGVYIVKTDILDAEPNI